MPKNLCAILKPISQNRIPLKVVETKFSTNSKCRTIEYGARSHGLNTMTQSAEALTMKTLNTE